MENVGHYLLYSLVATFATSILFFTFCLLVFFLSPLGLWYSNKVDEEVVCVNRDDETLLHFEAAKVSYVESV